MTLKTLVVGPLGTNCYILGCSETGKAAIIDPGDEAERILEAVRAESLTPDCIINTHAHIDHTAAVQAIKEAAGIPFHLHEGDQTLLKNLPAQAMAFGLSYSGTAEADSFLEDGQKLMVGQLEIEVLHTPGHSPGSVSFLVGEALIVGDTLFAGSIGRTDLPGGSFETLIASVKTRLFGLADETIAYPGHGPETTIGEEKRSNPFLS